MAIKAIVELQAMPGRRFELEDLLESRLSSERFPERLLPHTRRGRGVVLAA